MAKSTLILQSHRELLPSIWLQICIDSVKFWAQDRGFAYEFVDDALFDEVDLALRDKLARRTVILTDLARLHLIRARLKRYQRVVWIDADVLVFHPSLLDLPELGTVPGGYMLGNEVWVQSQAPKNRKNAPNTTQKYRAYKSVHNAFLLFEQHNAFLAFYLFHAQQLIENLAEQAPVPNQFIGPKLLTALHNIVGCPRFDRIGMLSPCVAMDLLKRADGQALSLFRLHSPEPIAGLNLCESSVQSGELSDCDLEQLCNALLERPNMISSD